MKAIEFIENEIGNAHDNPNLDNEMLAELFDKYAEARADQHETIVIGSLPDDEEIAKWVKEHGYYGHCTPEYHEGLEEGARWMRDLISNDQ